LGLASEFSEPLNFSQYVLSASEQCKDDQICSPDPAVPSVISRHRTPASTQPFLAITGDRDPDMIGASNCPGHDIARIYLP
jgi:hypothetical protein